MNVHVDYLASSRLRGVRGDKPCGIAVERRATTRVIVVSARHPESLPVTGHGDTLPAQRAGGSP